MRYAVAAVAALLLSVGLGRYSVYALWTKKQLADMDAPPSAVQRLMIWSGELLDMNFTLLIVIVTAQSFLAAYVAPKSGRSGPAR